ncbi:acyl-CoA dehydrogenase family protein, partial [Actinomadura adrarensis]
MGHYKSNLRDVEFNLFEVFRRQDVLGSGPFADLDEDTARSILEEVVRLSEGPIAESFEDADRNPPVFDPEAGTVTMPESFKKSFQAYMDAEWFRMDLTPDFGGTGAPRSLVWAAAEQILGANPAVHMFSSGPGFSQILYNIGTPEQKKFAEIALERQWGATMVLTEPDAGSDVGA